MPIQKSGFPWKKPKRISFDLYHWQILLFLSQQGRPIQESLKIIRNERNEKDIDSIISLLNQGVSLKEILARFSDPIANKGSFFLDFMTLDCSLATAIDLTTFEDKLKEKLRNSLVYPISLLFFSVIILIVFSYVVLPNVLSVVEGSSSTSYILPKIITFLDYFFILGTIIGVSITILFYYMKKTNHILELWIWLHRIHKDKIISKLITYVFSQYFLELLKSGLSTKQSLESLEQLKNEKSISYLAELIINELNKGNDFVASLDNKLIDKQFLLIVSLGYKAQQFKQALNEYNTLIENWLKNAIKKFSMTLQIGAYLSIGIIVIVIYQAMLIPMSLLNEM